jgi:hypothetical protein
MRSKNPAVSPEEDGPKREPQQPSDEESKNIPVRNVLVSNDVMDVAAELFFKLHDIAAAKPVEATPQAERRRTIRFLVAINDFVKRAWPQPPNIVVRRFLFNLAAHIDQLDDGVVHPIFVPAPSRGPKHDTIDVWRVRNHVSLAVELLMRTGKTRDAAAGIIAKQMPALKRVMRHKRAQQKSTSEDRQSSIVSWHRQFQQGTVPEIMRDGWKDRIKELDELCLKPEFTKGDLTPLVKAHLRIARTAIETLVVQRLPRAETNWPI